MKHWCKTILEKTKDLWANIHGQHTVAQFPRTFNKMRNKYYPIFTEFIGLDLVSRIEVMPIDCHALMPMLHKFVTIDEDYFEESNIF